MISPIIKESTDLSENELRELNALSRIVNPKNPENHVQINHINKTNPTFYLFKNEEKLLAYQAFTLFKRLTPFEKKEISIIYINASYKNTNSDTLVKDYAKKSNLHFIKQNLGYFWFFKKFLVIFITDNPKLLNRVSKAFYVHAPSYKAKTTRTLQTFCEQFISENLRMEDASVSENLVISQPYHSQCRINNYWDSMYKASDKAQNDFFYREKIILKKENDILLSGKGILFIGFYSFSNLIKTIYKQIIKPKQN